MTSVRLPWLLWLQTNQLTSIEHDTEHDVEQRQRQLHSFFFLFSIKATQCSWLVRGNIKSVIISTSHREVPLCPIHITWLQFVWIHHEQWAWDLRSSSWSFYTEIVITMASTKIKIFVWTKPLLVFVDNEKRRRSTRDCDSMTQQFLTCLLSIQVATHRILDFESRKSAFHKVVSFETIVVSSTDW